MRFFCSEGKDNGKEIRKLLEVHVIFFRVRVIVLSCNCPYIKHQWEQLSSNCPHSFQAFQLSKSSYGYKAGRVHQDVFNLTYCLWLLRRALLKLPLKLSIRYSFQFTFPDGVFSDIERSDIFRNHYFFANFRFFNLSVPEDIIALIFRLIPSIKEELPRWQLNNQNSFHSASNTFDVRLTRMFQMINQLRRIFWEPHLRSSLLWLTWYIKITTFLS
jgi:hypothetical protein